jgi:hypothetical protein
MSAPFAKAASSIPITLLTVGALPPADEDVAVLTLQDQVHDHSGGVECAACVSAGDVRARLFDLLTEARLGMRKPFSRVVIDARALHDPKPVIDRLDPHAPAIAFRDHTVVRSFHLSRVI